MKRGKPLLTLLRCGIYCLAMPRIALSYRVNCNDNSSFTVKNITSIFGEARPACDGDCKPSRFHEGTDIADSDCSVRNNVRAIEGGTVTKVVPTGNESYVWITNTSDGRAFRYLHIVPSVKKGDPINANDKIGTVASIKHPHSVPACQACDLSFYTQAIKKSS